MSKTTKLESIKLYTDEATFKLFKAKEEQIEKLVGKYEEIIESTIGNIKIDYKLLTYDPIKYVTEAYFEVYGKNIAPDSANKVSVYESASRLSVSRLTDIKGKIESLSNEMGKYAPIFNEWGSASRCSLNFFDRYLNIEKAEEYNTLKTFLESVKELEQYGSGNNRSGLLRCHSSLMWSGIEIVINPQYFIC